MFSIGQSGDGAGALQTRDFLWNSLQFAAPSAQVSALQCRQYCGGEFQAVALPTYGQLIQPSTALFCARQPVQPPCHQSYLLPTQPALLCYQRTKPSHSQDCRLFSSTSLCGGAGDGAHCMPAPIFPTCPPADDLSGLNLRDETLGGFSSAAARKVTSLNEADEPRCRDSAEKLSDVEIAARPEEAPEDCSEEGKDGGTMQKKLQMSLEKFLLKIVELYDKLRYNNRYSPNQYKETIHNILIQSRQLFYKLESVALCEILRKRGDWKSTSEVADVFHHDYFSMADILAVYLLQLIHAYSEHGFISIDPSGSNPLSMASFYRGEFRVGRVLPGVYQMHVTSFHYTACTKMVQAAAPCPLRRNERRCGWRSGLDVSADLQHWSECFLCDPFHRSVPDEEDVFLGNADLVQYVTAADVTSEDASSLLKMLSWRVRFLQNPDLPEENYYLCCKAIKPYFHEPEFIFQSDSFKYFFGKLVSPQLNFTNPSLEEIVLDCRPSGRFEVLHSFGHQLPLYSAAVGVLVDYLRHKRFRRTVF